MVLAMCVVLMMTASATGAGSEGKPLAGRVVCIDPGHQGKGDPAEEAVGPGSAEMKAKMAAGATGVASKVPEYKLTLAVGLKVKAELEKLGATVVMTRETNDVNISNKERAELANKKGAELVVRIHADGASDGKVKGVSVLVPGKAGLKDEAVVAKSRKAGEVILQAYAAATGAASRGVVERNDMTGFNWSTVPVVLIELGFMSNAEEDQLMETEAYQGKMAEGIVKGVVGYLK
jgi:N-acetylmuramoyl-L-alanine amidase